MQKNRIKIVYATNNKYAPYASVSIASLIKNASKDFFYDISVFHTGLQRDTLLRFNSMQGENYSVKPLAINRFIEEELKLMYTNFHFSKEMFYRILIPHIFPDCAKAIYLDCDTVVLGDISELYNLDLGMYLLGAANDVMHPISRNYVKNELKLPVSDYINSGVLLINCELFRAEKIKELCFQTLAERRNLRYPDQDLINLVCAGRIKLLERKWNYIWQYHIVHDDPVRNLPPEEMKQYVDDASNLGILHFTSNVKPWNNRICPLSEHFWEYVPSSPFEDVINTTWKGIPRKRYVTYKFLDHGTNGLWLTASLQSLDGLDNGIVVCVNGDEISVTKTYEQIAEIAGQTYIRIFFEFFLPYEAIDKGTRITIYGRETGEPIQTYASESFPVNFAMNSFYSDERYTVYYCENSLCFVTPDVERTKQLERAFRLWLKGSVFSKDKLKVKAYCLRLLYKLLRPFVKKEIWLISDRTDSAGDNGQALFEYLAKNPVDNVNVYFVIDKKSPDYRKIKKTGKVISPFSKLYKICVLFATRNISSQMENCIMRPIYCAQYLCDILFKCKNVFLQHGIIKDDLSMIYNRCAKNIRMFVTAAKPEYSSIAHNPAYGCGERVTKLTGLARYDKLVDEKEKIIFIVPTWRKSCVEDFSSGDLIDSFESTSYFGFYNALLHDERLIQAAKEHGYRICFYQHHLMRKALPHFGKFDEIFIDPAEFTYNDMFRKGALLFTDFSSVQFDFVYLRKPIVYCHFDKAEFYAGHTYRQGYFDYERDGFGEVVYNEETAVDTIIAYLQNDCQLKDSYSKRIDSFFAYHDRKNCQRTVNEILKL